MWYKKLRIRKTQSIMIFIIIMVSSLLISTSSGIILSLQQPISSLVNECNAPVMKIYPYGNDYRAVKDIESKIKKVKGVKDVDEVNVHQCREKITSNDKELEYRLNLVEYDNSIYKNHLRFMSNKTEKLDDNECMISQIIASYENIKCGDLVTVDNGSSKVNYKVNAIYTDPYAIDSPGMNDILVGKIHENFKVQKVLYVNADNDIKASNIINDYKDKNDGILMADVEIRDDYVDNSQLAIRTMGGIFLGVSFLLLIVSILMIRFMIKSAVTNDSMTIAVYKSIGYSSRDIISIYLKLYLFLVAIASIAGSCFSKIVINKILQQDFMRMGLISSDNGYFVQLVCIAVIVATSLFVCLKSLKSIIRIKPILVFNGQTDEKGAKHYKEGRFIKKLSFSPLGLALRNIVRDKRNTIYIIITCIASVFIINFGFQSIKKVYTMKQDNDYWFGIDKSDAVFQVNDDKKYDEMYNSLKSDSNVSKVIKNSTKIASLKWEKGIDKTNLPVKVYSDYKNLNMDKGIIDGRNPESADEVGISVNVAKETGKSVGDYLEIYVNKQKKNFFICEVYQTYYNLGYELRMVSSAFTDTDKNFNYDEMSVYLNKDTDLDKFIKDYNDKFSGYGKMIKRTEKYSVIMDKICSPQKRAIVPIIIVVLFLGAVNIFSIVSIKNLKGYKNNCIYKSIGYDSMHLIKSNVIYVLIIGLISIVLTLPVFMAGYSKIMSICLSFFGVKQYPADFIVIELVLCNASLMLLFVISSLISSMKIIKADVTDLNKE